MLKNLKEFIITYYYKFKDKNQPDLFTPNEEPQTHFIKINY